VRGGRPPGRSRGRPAGRPRADREERRLQLIEAAIATVNEKGLLEASVSQIAAAAGFTGAHLYRYFGDKEGLLAATMRHIVGLVQAERRRMAAGAADAEARFLALLAADLSPAVFRVDLCRAWLHFQAQASHVPALARLDRLDDRLLQRSLRQAAEALLPPPAAGRLAAEAAALIQGLRVQRAQRDEGFPPAQAQALVQAAMQARLRQLAAE